MQERQTQNVDAIEMPPTPVLLRRARNTLLGNWLVVFCSTAVAQAVFSALCFAVWWCIMRTLHPYMSTGYRWLDNQIISTLRWPIMAPMALGMTFYFLMLVRRGHGQFRDFFFGCRHYWRAICIYVWMNVALGLWFLCLVIPGLVAFFAYAMSCYLVIDYPHLPTRRALGVSRRMMEGHKVQLLGLNLRYLGLFSLLFIIGFTCQSIGLGWGGWVFCGLGYVWTVVFFSTALAHFYESLKQSVPLDQWVAEAIGISG